MTSAKISQILRYRFRSLKKSQRISNRIEQRRRKRIRGFRLHNRLQIDLYNRKMIRDKRREEQKKKIMARRETAKLNRTLRRRRKR